MYGIRVNPLAIKPGDSIATKFEFDHIDFWENIDVFRVNKSRQVKKVAFCETSPESVHLDHECYDTRFTTVVRPQPGK